MTLLGLLLTLGIILLLFYLAMNTYFKKPAVDKETQDSLSGQGIDASSYTTVMDSTKKKVKEIENQMSDYEKQLEKTR